jgi:hypothetical protein
MVNIPIFKIRHNKSLVSKIEAKLLVDDVKILDFNTAYKFNGGHPEWDKYNVFESVIFKLSDGESSYTDFLYLHDGVIIFSQNILNIDLLHQCFYYGSEILKIQVEGSPLQYYLCNVCNASNPLNYQFTKFGQEREKQQKEILDYHFHNDRSYSNYSFFKLPVDWLSSIYSMSYPMGEQEPDPYRIFKKYKIKHLLFEKIYTLTFP